MPIVLEPVDVHIIRKGEMEEFNKKQNSLPNLHILPSHHESEREQDSSRQSFEHEGISLLMTEQEVDCIMTLPEIVKRQKIR